MYRKTLIILLFALISPSIRAQQDTLQYLDSCYLFNEMPENLASAYWKSSPNTNPIPNCDIAIQYSVSAKTEILGIAVTMDSLTLDDVWRHYWDTIEWPDSASYSVAILRDTVRPAWLTDTLGLPVSMKKSLKVLRRSSFKHNAYRFCKFKYQYTHNAADCSIPYVGGGCSPCAHWDTILEPKPSEKVVNCFEFYFTRPVVVDGDLMDSFYVGRSNRYIAGTNPEPHFREHCGWAVPGDRVFVWKTTTAFPRYTEMMDENSIHWQLEQCQNRWGTLFPIVKFRCTPPRDLAISNQPDQDRVATWRQHDDAVEWQLYAGTSDTTMDVIGPVTVFDTSYQFPELLLDTTMVVGVRKACRYTTSAYDTVVWSNWTTLAVPPIETPDTTGIGQQLSASGFAMAPVPAKDMVWITLGASSSEGGELMLCDLQGRCLVRRMLLPGEGRVSLSLEGLADGVYLVRLLSAGTNGVQRLAVVR